MRLNVTKVAGTYVRVSSLRPAIPLRRSFGWAIHYVPALRTSDRAGTRNSSVFGDATSAAHFTIEG